MALYCQLVVGAPGSGKTTYCTGIHQWYECIGRSSAIVNLDPANERLPYTPAIDIRDLITLDDIMEEFSLGPNGGLVYALEFLEENIEWLKSSVEEYAKEHSNVTFVFDLPGQIEMYTHHRSVRNVIGKMKKWGWNCAVVNLMDAHHCTDPYKYLSILLVSLSTMIHLNAPAIHILSKIDLLSKYGELDFKLDFYTDVLDLEYLLERFPLGDPFSDKFRGLTESLIETLQDYNMVSFETLDIMEKSSVEKVARVVDSANGFLYSSLPKDTNLLESVFDFGVKSSLVHHFESPQDDAP